MPTAGWYADPDGSGGLRYWDGGQWTAYVHAVPASAPWPAPAPLPKAGSPATGPLPLHPMSVADILDGIFKLLKANFRTIAVIVCVLVVPIQIVLAFLSRGTLGGHGIIQVINDPSIVSRTNRSLTTTVLQLCVELVDVLMLPFIGGAVATVVANSYLGREIGPAQALRAAAGRFWALVGGWWIHIIGELLGLLCCIVGIVPAMALFMMIAPAIVTEQLGAWQGVKRSWRLTSRRFWPTVGIMLLVAAMSSVMANVLGVVPETLGLAIGLHWGWILLALGGTVTALVVTPIAAIAATLLYFDARIRSEGFDLQVMAAGLAVSAG